jgi:hypothetical protein
VNATLQLLVQSHGCQDICAVVSTSTPVALSPGFIRATVTKSSSVVRAFFHHDREGASSRLLCPSLVHASKHNIKGSIPPSSCVTFLPCSQASSTFSISYAFDMADATKEETSRVEAPRGSVVLQTTDDVNRIEAPVTLKAYLICAFASFGGIFFGYDSGYVNGVLGNSIFIENVEGPDADAISSSHQSLIVSILSLGTFLGALIGGDAADFIGRKWTVILGCVIYTVGVIIQMITGEGDALAAIVVGRVVAGIGVGFESAIVILYMSEIVSIPLLYLTKSDHSSAPAKFVVLSLLATNSASLSVFCSPPSSSMQPRTDPTLAHTASPSPFNLPGL